MYVFLTDKQSRLAHMFERPIYDVPFLNGTLLRFLLAQLPQGAKVFVPAHWDDLDFPKFSAPLSELGKDEWDVVLFLNPTCVPTLGFFDEDFAYFKQNPGKLFVANGVIGGYLSGDTDLSPPVPFTGGFRGVVQLNELNYLTLSQALLANLEGQSVELPSGIRVFGSPIVLSNSISNSTICGPAFISEGCMIHNCYIGPGSVIINSHLVDCRVFGAAIFGSRVFSSEADDSLIALSVVEGIPLITNSSLSGANLHGTRALQKFKTLSGENF